MSFATRQEILTSSRVMLTVLLFGMILGGSGKLFLETKEKGNLLVVNGHIWLKTCPSLYSDILLISFSLKHAQLNTVIILIPYLIFACILLTTRT